MPLVHGGMSYLSSVPLCSGMFFYQLSMLLTNDFRNGMEHSLSTHQSKSWAYECSWAML